MRSGSNSDANKRLMCMSAVEASKRPTKCLGVYTRSMCSANRQQYLPQTVLVKLCSCVVLYSQTVHAQRKQVMVLGTRGGKRSNRKNKQSRIAVGDGWLDSAFDWLCVDLYLR